MKENTLSNNVVYFAKLHWIIFFAPVISLFVTLAVGILIPQLNQVVLILSIGIIIWIFMTWVNYFFSSLTVEKKRVILRTGVLVRQTVDIPLNKIETTDIRQSILGSIFQYGSLVITGTGGTRHIIPFLQRPLTCRRYIEQMMNEQ